MKLSHILPDGRRVSTVDLMGIDHNFTGEGPPLLYETMVFPPESFSDLYCRRYATADEATAGHAEVIAECEKGEHA